MGIKAAVLGKLMEVVFWGEKEFRLGPVSILFCDLSISIHLVRNPSIEEIEAAIRGKFALQTIPTYGIVIEPFMVSLMGSDGDVYLQSPGVDMMSVIATAANKAEAEAEAAATWLNLGDLIVTECHIQGRHGVNYIFGDEGYPCLGVGLRFREPTGRFAGRVEFTPHEAMDEDLSSAQLSEACHEIEIHKDDANEFFTRIKKAV